MIYIFWKRKKEEQQKQDLVGTIQVDSIKPGTQVQIKQEVAPEVKSSEKIVKDEKVLANGYQPVFNINFETEVPKLPDIGKDITSFDFTYPIIEPFVKARIYYDSTFHELIYQIIEPELDHESRKILRLIESAIEELINISFIAIKDQKTVIEFLEKNVLLLLNEFKINVSKEIFVKMMYYVYRDFVGMNKLEPLMRDYFIEDIECNGIQSPIYIVHRKYKNLRSNIVYKTIPELTKFVEKLAQKAGKYISYANPILDGTMPDGSIDYEEPVIYKEDGIIKVNKIGEIVDKHYKNETNIPINVTNLEVPAFDPETLKIKWNKVDYVYKHKINEDLFEIKTEFGKKVRLTGCHSIFKLTKQGVKAERTDNLFLGDYVAIPLTIPQNENLITEINLVEKLAKTEYNTKLVIGNVPKHIYSKHKEELKSFYLTNYKRVNQAYYEHRKKGILPLNLYHLLNKEELEKCTIRSTSAHGIKPILQINRDLMRFLGLYIAEGWYSKVGNKYQVSFSLNKNEENLIEDLRKSIKNCFNLNIYVEHPVENGIKVHATSYVLYVVLKEILKISKGAKIKRIPELVFNVDKELQKEFLSAWKDGDYGSTASSMLSEDISYLSLFNQNNVPFYRRERNEIYIKNHLARGTVEYYTNSFVRRINNPYHEMIPIEIFNPLKDTHMRLKSKKISRERLNNIINTERYNSMRNLNTVNSIKFIKEWSNRGFIQNKKLTEKGDELLSEIDVIKKLINSDLGFAKVTSINKVKSTSEFVYDFSVVGYENFIGGVGGLCCHNSRINATYSQDISSKGPSMSIRKFTKEPWTPIHLMKFKTVSPEILAYIWLLVENGANIMVVGGTGSGKCVTGDTLIKIPFGRAKIKNLVEKEFSKNKIWNTKDGYFTANSNLEVLSFNSKTLGFEIKKVTQVWKRKSTEYLIMVKTKNGLNITVTPEHPFFISERKTKIKQIRADELKNKMNVASLKVRKEKKFSESDELILESNLELLSLEFDEIINIEKIKSSEEWVYDLTVEDNHTFIGNNLVVHNTSLLNTVAFFIPPSARVVSIEDTRELQLMHENWLPSVARQGIGFGENKQGEVTLFDLLKASFRQRPDQIIVGEIRGAEAFVLFQAAASGHAAMATMHANDVPTMVRRLETQPINLPPSLVQILDVACVMAQVKVQGKFVRRLVEVTEIVNVSEGVGGVETNSPFFWDPKTDRFYFKEESHVFEKLSVHRGLSKEELYREFQLRTKLFLAMYTNNIYDFKEVQSIIHEYFKDPKKILDRFGIV